MARTLQELLDGFDDAGAAACVVREGEIVEEAVTGTLDGARSWAIDTLTMTYSCAKPFAALTVLTAGAVGALGLDQRVAELWPAYAAHGKRGTTVRHVLAHQAGVPAFPEAAAGVEFDDREALVALLADAWPVHEPGTACAEHALTYGHLCDQLIRSATGEDLADRFARIAADQGWDLHLRVAAGDLDRVADPVARAHDWPHAYTDDPRWGPAMTRPPGLLDPAVLASERWRTTSFPAIGLHASARGLATFYGQLMNGSVRELLGEELHREYVGAQVTGHDLLLDREVTWTLGFQVDEDDLGMGGAGGSSGWWSFGGRYAAAFVTRGLGTHDRSDGVYELLEERYSRP
ncbi:MAG TPA: serine hydrolase domain-containing protein [Nocardioides sp.]|nr:serine hydrolase domain-containing protein [Nocardioides sp.]